jgi:hypothetical protein
MTRSRFTLMIWLVLVVAITGCDTTTNTNGNGNANKAVVTNTNTTMTTNTAATNANTTANANRPLNANIRREEYEKDRAYYEQEAKRLGRKIGAGANDLWLWTKTKAALGTADDLRDSTINVDVENDVVMLTGTVASAQQKIRAGEVAQKVEGVKSVRNNLTVSAEAGNINRNGNANR